MIDPSLENFYQRAKSEDPYFQFMKIGYFVYSSRSGKYLGARLR